MIDMIIANIGLYSIIFLVVLMIVVIADSRTTWKSKLTNVVLFIPVLISLITKGSI